MYSIKCDLNRTIIITIGLLTPEWLDQSWCAAWENCVYSQTSPTIQYPQQQHTTTTKAQREKGRLPTCDGWHYHAQKRRSARLTLARTTLRLVRLFTLDGWMDGWMAPWRRAKRPWTSGTWGNIESVCRRVFYRFFHYMCPRAPFNCLTFLSSRDSQS